MATEITYNIYYDAETNCVVMNWEGYSTSKQLREGTEYMLDLLMENGTSKVLAAIENMVLIGSDDQHWIENSFLPNAIEKGFKAIAIVKPSSYFNAVAIESLIDKIDNEKLSISVFDDVDNAKDWLKNLPF